VIILIVIITIVSSTITSELEVDLVAVPVLVHEVPVDNSREVAQVGSAGIAVVDVVGVLPDIDGQQRVVSVGEGVAGVGGIEDGNLLSLLGEPGPSRPEVAQRLRRELLDEVVDAAPLADDQVLQLAGRLSLVGSDAVPVEGVVPVLGSIVEDL
jgi:hypothetical protein